MVCATRRVPQTGVADLSKAHYPGRGGRDCRLDDAAARKALLQQIGYKA
jgi:hypothetical protein